MATCGRSWRGRATRRSCASSAPTSLPRRSLEAAEGLRAVPPASLAPRALKAPPDRGSGSLFQAESLSLFKVMRFEITSCSADHF